ncbi:MAG: hypothetical protein Q7T35_10525 [Nitrosomonas sp.]|jgi:hypothetical protein|nr:hypothetical protein [Nitrosomonas sp.]
MVSERIIGHGKKILSAFSHRNKYVFIALAENMGSAWRIDVAAAIYWLDIWKEISRLLVLDKWERGVSAGG